MILLLPLPVQLRPTWRTCNNFMRLIRFRRQLTVYNNQFPPLTGEYMLLTPKVSILSEQTTYLLSLSLLHSWLQTPTGRARHQKPKGPSREDSPVRKGERESFLVDGRNQLKTLPWTPGHCLGGGVIWSVASQEEVKKSQQKVKKLSQAETNYQLFSRNQRKNRLKTKTEERNWKTQWD